MTEVGYEWTANDMSNLVTISAAAAASVLLVLFKSRCSSISLCWGLWTCSRVLKDTDETEDDDEDDEAPREEELSPPVRVGP